MFDGRWRDAVDRTTGPVGQALQRHGVTADVLTASGLVFAIATAVAVGLGHLHLAIILLALTGFHDLFDGPVAKAAGTASVRGAFFDSVVDRVADAVIMCGVAWYLVSADEGHLVLLPLAVLGVTSLISYERAKAEALGLSEAKGGLMERAERMILLGVGFLASFLLVPILWVLLALTSLTAAGRFVRVWRAADGPVRPAAPAALPDGDGARALRPRWGQGRVESRWRAWREGASPRRTTRAGQPVGRWRARRQEALASRSGRTMRARRRDQDRRTALRNGSFRRRP
jgi:CDP-diacylglycerol--glycerol-3-phosphate 3-phosphatidyltransferase